MDIIFQTKQLRGVWERYLHAFNENLKAKDALLAEIAVTRGNVTHYRGNEESREEFIQLLERINRHLTEMQEKYNAL